jgi:serine phosphatase RsbU (regulator of sigma subunit)/Tfp pilus assembly protein PilF
MKTRRLTLIILSFFGCAQSFATKLDSLKSILKTTAGKEKVEILNTICDSYVYVNPDSAMRYGELGLELAKKTGYRLFEAAILTNIGNIYVQSGEYAKALDRYIEAEKIYDEIKEVRSKIPTIINIGYVYELQNVFDKALEQYQLALSVSKEGGYKNSEAEIYGHLGSLYYTQKDKEKALEYFSLSLKANQETDNIPGIMEGLNNVAIIYQELGRYEEALQNFRTDLKYAEKSGIKTDIIAILHNIALVYKDGKKYNEALRYLDSSIVIARNIRDFGKLQEVYSTTSEIYKKQNNIEKSFEYFQLSVAARDSLTSQTRDKQFIEMSTKYDTEKKDAENKLLKSEGEKQRAVLIGIGIGLILVVLLAYLIFRNYKVQQRANVLLGQQNTEIKEQKHIIEEKQKEILDSIAYAKKLQEAILPPVNLMHQQFENMFLYYQPKDIVAGDFYWMETVKLGNEEHILIAAADSTGHGVPGAMVSVVCSNALNRAVKEFKITEPGEILDKARELVLETFAKSERDVKDGMDISLASIPKVRKGDATLIKWAGANNPIYIVSEGAVKEIKANKFPVGAYATEQKQNFTTHNIELKNGDRIYLFSDGLVDQFGGPNEKKYKAKRMQLKMLESCYMQMKQQKDYLRSDLLSWQGKLEQVDDILVIGVEI